MSGCDVHRNIIDFKYFFSNRFKLNFSASSCGNITETLWCRGLNWSYTLVELLDQLFDRCSRCTIRFVFCSCLKFDLRCKFGKVRLILCEFFKFSVLKLLQNLLVDFPHFLRERKKSFVLNFVLRRHLT